MKRFWISAFAVGTATPAAAQTSTINPADTAWMIVATALVLMMTIPGLALFYAGLVRKKNLLATMAQCFAAVMFVSVLWFMVGYTLTFSGSGAYLGNLEKLFFAGMTLDSVNPIAQNIPESLFATYQMTFAIITCALIAGSVADRMRFSAFLLFIVAWLFVVYIPSAHWIWGGGFLASMGVMDFAGGIVVHLNAGVAGLVAAYVLGARRGYGTENLAPYDLTMAAVGTALLWVGWFGFNGGSALSAGSRATMAIATTHLAACAGAIAWMMMEWWARKKPSMLGIISGAIAGLGTITPASGFVLPWHGVVIGLLAGIVCYWACTWLKERLRYDDSLDVFGIHGIGGILGTILTGVFAVGAFTASKDLPAGQQGLLEGNAAQVMTQIVGVAISFAWCAIATYVILKIIDAMIGLRVSLDHERMGLDITQHGESVHT